MTALADTNVTLTKVKKHRIGLMRECIYQVSFGNAALTVPANGVPLPALAQFGGLRTVKFHQIAPVTIDGYDYKYDEVNHSIRIFQSAIHNHDSLYIGGIATTEAVMIASGDTLGKNAATNRTI